MAEVPVRRGRDALARKGALRFLLEPPSTAALAHAAEDHPLTQVEQRAIAALAWATHELDKSPIGDNTDKSEALTDVLVLAACADGEVQPNELRVRAGEPTAVVIVNESTESHSFDVDTLGIHVRVPGKSTAVALVQLPAGAPVPFYCGIPGHREAGMKGSLVVE